MICYFFALMFLIVFFKKRFQMYLLIQFRRGFVHFEELDPGHRVTANLCKYELSCVEQALRQQGVHITGVRSRNDNG